MMNNRINKYQELRTGLIVSFEKLIWPIRL